MTKYTTTTPTSTSYAVISRTDAFGTGYLVQRMGYLQDAIRDGWQVVMTNLRQDVAENVARIYRTAGKGESAIPSFDDLITYDMTELAEDRDSTYAEEFDLVLAPIETDSGLLFIEATITSFDEDSVELDGYILVERSLFLEHASLIAKADADSGFIVEYGKWLNDLDSNWRTLYDIAAQTQTRMVA